VDIDICSRSDDGSLTPQHAYSQWQQYLCEATAAAGKPLRYEHRTGQMLRDAGFVDIQEVVLRLPINTWPTDPYLKDCGRWYQLGMMEGLEGFSLGPMCRVLKWAAEDVRNFLKRVTVDIKSKQVHAYSDVYVTH
jgi:hypothetical protein